jgi:tetratricopeptide (TPR) repeat protein
VFDDRPVAGTGAGTFRISRLRYRESDQVFGHAHGFVPQTLADLGLLGLGLSAALLVAWLLAAARGTALLPRLRRRAGPRRDWTPDRIALVALGLVVVAFGLQSTIDWIWFVPGPSVMALAAAGFVAGRGAFAPASWAGELPEQEAPERSSRVPAFGREMWLPPRRRLVVALAVLVVAALAAWATWRPEASDRASDRALALVEQHDYTGALEEASDAEDLNPLTPRPLFAAASAHTAAGRERSALRVLERAVLRYPGDPATWLQLATFQLNHLDRPAQALESLRALLYLDPRSKAGRQLFLEARAREREQRRATRLNRLLADEAGRQRTQARLAAQAGQGIVSQTGQGIVPQPGQGSGAAGGAQPAPLSGGTP